jgi:acetyltransferase EpsM
MDIILLGAGGHAKDIITNIEDMNRDLPAARRVNLLGCLDDTGVYNPDIEQMGYELFTEVKSLAKRALRNASLLCAVGDPLGKKRLIQKTAFLKPKFANLIHPSAVISGSVKMGRGVTVFAYSVISGLSKAGDHSSVNFHCSVSHDCVVGDYATLCPGVNVAGRVNIGEGVFMGIGSCCLNKVDIGAWSVIGAGSTVTKSIPAYSVAAGTPHRIIGKREKGRPVI